MSIRRQLASTYLAEAIKFVAAIAFGVVSARALEPAGRGMLGAALSSVSIGVMFANLGVGKALISRLNQDENGFGKQDYYGALLLYLPVAAVIGFVMVTLVAPDFLPGERVLAWSILGLATVVSLAAPLVMSALRARRRIIELNAIGVTASLVRLAALVVLWKNERVTVLAVLSIELIYWSLLCLASAYMLRRSLVRRPRFDKSAGALRSLMSYGISFQVYSLLFGLSIKMMIPLMLRVSGPDAAGYLSVSARLAEYLGTLSNQILFVMVPFLAQLRTQESTRQYSLLFCRIGIVFLVPLVLILVALSHPIIVGLYGAAFEPSVPLFRILVVGSLFGVLFQFLTAGPVSKGFFRGAWIGAAAGLVTATLLMLVLVPNLSDFGAAVAVAVGYVTAFVVYLLYTAWSERIALSAFLLPTKADIDRVFRRPS